MREDRDLAHISPVLVIFVATQPQKGGGVIAGWYKNARLYKEPRRYQGTQDERAEASAAEAVLVPEGSRDHPIPQATAVATGMGHSNIFYLFEPNGSRRQMPWAEEAIRYVLEYAGPNALRATEVDVPGPSLAAEIDADRKAGFASDPKIRKAIEKCAMDLVRHEYRQKRGIELTDRSATEPYDFSYTDGGQERYIEVKGSQGMLSGIILTKKEVEFARKHADYMELCLVQSIKVEEESGEIITSGGVVNVFSGWNPDLHALEAIQYRCGLNKNVWV